jgi:hypothetical protein
MTKVFYANENYTKYEYSGINYFMVLMAATFYIVLTGGQRREYWNIHQMY